LTLDLSEPLKAVSFQRPVNSEKYPQVGINSSKPEGPVQPGALFLLLLLGKQKKEVNNKNDPFKLCLSYNKK